MIKKQLGLLAGSVILASSVNAAIALDATNAVAVFNTAGAGSYYQLVPGATGDSLIAGIEFSMDISAATAALGGSIDSFALLAYGPNDCNGTIDGNECYNYTEFQYIETYNGLIYTGDTAMATTNIAANIETLNIVFYLSNAVMGLNGEGSLGDADGSFVLSKYLSTNQTNLVFNQQVGGEGYYPPTADSTNAQLLTGSIFIEGGSLQFNQVPIPTTAWLFGSALAGLLVARRQQK